MFTLFQALPVELQRKIWHYTLPGPRIIQVYRRGSDGPFYFNGARPPVALHTCRTSRAVACSIFKAAFTHDNTNKPLSPIYIDFAHDTIFTIPCGPWTAPYEALAGLFPDTQKIQSLAVEVFSPDKIEMVFYFIMLPYLKLEGNLGGDLERIAGEIESDLKEIVVVVGHQSPLYEFKHPENVTFSEPEARPWLPWKAWRDIEARWTEELSLVWKRGVVRFKEVKIV
jgi:hypothetical protein